MKVLAVLALCAAAVHGIDPSPTLPSKYEGEEFILETSMSIITNAKAYSWNKEFSVDGCGEFQRVNGGCDIAWYGMQPAVFQRSNTQRVDFGGQKSMKLNMGSSTNAALFETANNATTDECGCDYNTWTSAVLKSYKTFRENVRCGMYELGSDKIELSVWSQSENEETSMTLSSDNGVTTLLGEAFYFENGETVSSASQSADISQYGSTGLGGGTQFQICVEWRRNDDLVFFAGDHQKAQTELFTLAGSQWRGAFEGASPEDMAPWNRQVHYQMIDVQFKQDAVLDEMDTAATLNGAYAYVHYYTNHEANCLKGSTTYTSSKAPSGPANDKGAVGQAGDCGGIYADFCERYNFQANPTTGVLEILGTGAGRSRNLCENPFPDGVEVIAGYVTHTIKKKDSGTAQEDFCAQFTSGATCSGYLAYRLSKWGSGRGALGLCTWDYSAKVPECVPKYDKAILAKIATFDKNKCISYQGKLGPAFMNSYYPVQFCLGECGQMTKVNSYALDPSRYNDRFGHQWYLHCGGHMRADTGEDICESFGHHTDYDYGFMDPNAVPGDTDPRRWKGRYGVCSAWKKDIIDDNGNFSRPNDEQAPSPRGRHCAYAYSTTVPYDISDAQGNSFNEGDALKGSYCKSQASSDKLWKYHGTNEATCKLAMGDDYKFECLTFTKTFKDSTPPVNRTGFRCISPAVDLNNLASAPADEGPLFQAQIVDGDCVEL